MFAVSLSDLPVEWKSMMEVMRLIQIPYSHNCIKVRRALELKALSFETEDIRPMDRSAVRSASGQGLVPVLVDGSTVVTDSTAILLYLEEHYPDRSLLPSAADARAECLLLEDWADQAFMKLTRRLAYWQVLTQPGGLEALFFPGVTGLRRTLGGRIARRAVRKRFRLSEPQQAQDLIEARRVARLAVDRLGRRPHLIGDRVSIADVALAAMSAPLGGADLALRADPAVRELLAWGRGVVGEPYGTTQPTSN